jgi:hypothetical protein
VSEGRGKRGRRTKAGIVFESYQNCDGGAWKQGTEEHNNALRGLEQRKNTELIARELERG